MLLRVRGTKFWIFQSHSHCLSSFSLSILTGLRRVARDMDNDDNRERIEACIQKEARKLLIICRNSDHSKRIRPTGNIMHRALLWPSSSGGLHTEPLSPSVWPWVGTGMLTRWVRGIRRGSGWAEC